MKPIDKNLKGLATVARMDALSRISKEEWRAFLMLLIKRPLSRSKYFRRKHIWALAMAAGWDVGPFNICWTLAKHHELVVYRSVGFRAGPLLEAVVADAGSLIPDEVENARDAEHSSVGEGV